MKKGLKISKDIWNKCDVCGKFIPYNDFQSGKAIRFMIMPDSELTSEEYQTLCKEHKESKMSRIGTHRTHCCKFHGCKYGDPDCPVENEEIEQDYPCEDCSPTDEILLKSIKEQVLYLWHFVLCSETRMPYTYHHDYLRANVDSMSKMSLSDIASMGNFSEDELYAIGFLQVLEHRAGADIVLGLNTDNIDIAKNVCLVGRKIFNEKYTEIK